MFFLFIKRERVCIPNSKISKMEKKNADWTFSECSSLEFHSLRAEEIERGIDG